MNLVWTAPGFLWLLPAIFLPLIPARQAALPISSLVPVATTRGWRVRLHRLHRPCCCLLLLGLVLILAGPTLRQIERRTVQLGVDLMLVLDISASMGAKDVEPDRMTAAQLTAAKFIRGRLHDRIGVILFSGVPYLLAPPSADRERVAEQLLAAGADRAGSGTALGDALLAGFGRLQSSSAKSRAVILLTDGSSNRGQASPQTAASAAAALGVRVYTIGFGTEQGASFTLGNSRVLPPNHPVVGQHRSTLDEEVLRELADSTGGRFFRATDLETLSAVYQQIDLLEKSPVEVQSHNIDLPLRELLLPLVAVLLTLEMLLFRAWLRKAP